MTVHPLTSFLRPIRRFLTRRVAPNRLHAKSHFCKLTLSSTLVLLLWAASSAIQAQALDPAMIEQLKRLPPAQQRAMARQYGIDLDAIAGGGRNSTPSLGMPTQPVAAGKTDNNSNTERLRDVTDDFEQDEKPSGLPLYGRQLFDSKVSTFAATDNAQVPDDYRLGVGDELAVQLYGKEDQQFTLQINRDGEVNFPKLGPIQLSGSSFSDAVALIQSRVTQQFIGVNAVVSMARLRAINVFMAGEVNTPGAFTVSSLTTVTQALFQAGGITDIGSLRNIQVKRAGEIVGAFDLYDLLLRGDASGDIRLRSGDVVFVPAYDSVVAVTGEVKRPARYELMPGQTLKDALNMAAGFSDDAFLAELILVSHDQDKSMPVVETLQLSDAKTMTRVLKDGDKLRIMPKGDALSNIVRIEGAATRPGVYGWRAGLRISDLVGNLTRDLLPTTDLQYALLIRTINDALDIEVQQFSPVDAALNPGSPDDLRLEAKDRLVFFELPGLTALDEDAGRGDQASNKNKNSRQALLASIIAKLRAQATRQDPVKIARISGAVRSPGEYPLGADYSLGQLVAAAGGMTDSAFAQGVELRRLANTSSNSLTASYETLDLTQTTVLSQTKLQSRDHVSIREIAEWNPDYSVTLSGEVVFPGTYFIQKGETLSDVIARAGGLTPEAFVRGAIFTREAIAELETNRAREFADSIRRDFAASILTKETLSSTAQEVEEVAAKLESFEGKGRLLVNLDRALMDDEAADLELVDGDTLTIPRKVNTVTVVGEVRRQATHTFQRGLDVEDYLNLSAGVSGRSDEDAIYIVKANGSVARVQGTSWAQFANYSQQLEPGDTIVVPVDSDYKESLALWRDITQIIYQGTVTIAAIANL